MATDLNHQNTGCCSTSGANLTQESSLTRVLLVSVVFCVFAAIGFHQSGWYWMQRSISEVDADGLIVLNDRMMRIGDLCYFIAIGFAAPIGMLGVILLSNVATRPASRLNSLGKTFWVMLAIACIPLVLLIAEILTLQNGADKTALNNRMWLYVNSGIVLWTLCAIPFGIRFRECIHKSAELKKRNA